jgi:hypothetical protein
VHRLVALAFLENPLGLPEVDHLDGDKENNWVGNLEWVTKKENTRRAVARLGVWLRAAWARVKKPVWMVDPVGKTVTRFGSTAEAIALLSSMQETAGGLALGPGAAANICHAKDRAKMAYGYLWWSRPVKDVEGYLGKLRPSKRSPLGGILLAGR